MAEENRGQTPEQELEQEPEAEPLQGEEPAQGPEENPQPDGQDEEKRRKGDMLMPILYALLAGVGAFTITLIIGIVLTYLNQPEEPLDGTPSDVSSSQVTASLSPEETETQGTDGGNDGGDAGDSGNADDDGGADSPG